MSMSDLQEALRVIASSAGLAFFAGPPDPTVVAAAERILGGKLSPTYREFVRKLGAGSFGAFEIYGVVDGQFEDSAVPNGVWLTLNERRANNLPDKLVIIGSTGDGDYYCIEQRDGEESPVIVHRAGVPPARQRREEVAHDFGQFLLTGVKGEI